MECNMTAILLSVRESGTADRIAVFFSKTHGKIRVFCPGSRRKNGRGGVLSPFSAVDLQLYYKQGNYQLVEAETLVSHDAICSDWERLAYGAIVAEAVEVLWPEEEAQIEVYEFLFRFFALLESRSPRIAAGAGLWKVLELAGFGAEFEACIHCGDELHEGRLSTDEGGFYGPCCTTGELGTKASKETLAALRILQEYPWDGSDLQGSIRGKELVAAEKILLEYLTYHLEKPLKSLEFLQKMEKAGRNPF